MPFIHSFKPGNTGINIKLRICGEINVALEKKAVLRILRMSVALVTQHARRMRRVI
jgi:hypothetical protein